MPVPISPDPVFSVEDPAPPVLCPVEAVSSVTAPAAEPDKVAEVRRLADAGAWDEAAALAHRLVTDEPMNAAAHLYYGLIQEQLGNLDRAGQALRRAIYLRRDLIMAHYHLGLLLRGANLREAARSLATASRLAALLPPDCILEHADGATAAEVLQMTNFQLETFRL
jgi:chemotaxis protein methyltransferase CheR